MIINFLDLPISILLEFNTINKKFYNQIIPDLMLPSTKDRASDWNKWSGKRFDCLLRYRIAFNYENNFYEIKELEDQMNKKIQFYQKDKI